MNPRRDAFTRLAFCALALACTPASADLSIAIGAKTAQANEAVAGETIQRIIIKYRAIGATARMMARDATRTGRLSNAARVGLSLHRHMALDASVFRLAVPMSRAEADAAAARIALDPDVEYAVPDIVQHALFVPNDPLFGSFQWDMMTSAAEPASANLQTAWDTTTGSAQTVVAVVDTGIRPAHPDLVGRLLPGYDFVSGTPATATCPANWRTGDGDGWDADPTDPGTGVTPAEAAACSATAMASEWHGTHVAGTIGANGNNGAGIAGADWHALILPVRVLGKDGSGPISDIADGVAWAAGLSVPGAPANPHPAKVVNLSVGGPGACSAPYLALFQQVTALGVVVVAAAGNDAAASVSSPANCPGVIAVTAHARDGDHAFYANAGAEVAISAPGGGCGYLSYNGTTGTCTSTKSDPILSTGNLGQYGPTTDDYITMMGTSQATPHVAGVASLLFGISPTLSATEIKSILQNSARPFVAGTFCASLLPAYAGYCGAGMLDAGAAAAYVINGLPTVSAGNAQIVTPGSTVTLRGAASAKNGRYISTLGWAEINGPSVTLANASQATASFTAPATGRLSLQLTAVDSSGYEASSSATVRVNSPPTVTIPGVASINVGQSFQFTVAGVDPDGDPITYVATDLPSGATFDAATGAFAFTPSNTGAYRFTVFGKDDVASGPVASVVLTAVAPATPSSGSGGGGAIHWTWLAGMLLASSMRQLTAARRRAS